MSIYDSLPGHERLEGLYAAKFATDAANFDELAFVVIPAWDDDTRIGPMPFTACNGSTLPNRDDPCVIGYDEMENPHIVAWWVVGGGSGFSQIRQGDLSTVLADRLTGDVLVDQEKTTDTTISATTEAAGDTVVTSFSFTFNGITSVMIEFFTPEVRIGGKGQITIDLWDNTAGIAIGRLASFINDATAAVNWGGVTCKRKITPANGSRVYSIRAWRGTTNGTIAAGNGGSGNNVPIILRITKA